MPSVSQQRRGTPERGARISEASVHILQQCPLFEGLAVPDLRRVLQAAQELRVKKGGFCFQQGDRATTLHVLTRGRVKQLWVGPSGRQVILRFIGPGEPFGFDALFGTAIRRVAAQAADDSQAVAWDIATLTRLMLTYPRISLNSLRLVVKRLVEVWDRLWDLSTEQVEQRIVRALLRLHAHADSGAGHGPAIELALSHQDVADLVGTTPYTVSRVLRRWERDRLVQLKRGVVRILQPHRLAAIAEDRGPLERPQKFFP